jgi:hypothetical protein
MGCRAYTQITHTHMYVTCIIQKKNIQQHKEAHTQAQAHTYTQAHTHTHRYTQTKFIDTYIQGWKRSIQSAKVQAMFQNETMFSRYICGK